jgi:plastocyanin
LTEPSLLISIYSQVIFGIGIALALAALLAIYVTSLASQSQSDVQQPQQQQQQIPSSAPSTSTSSPSPVSASITIPQGAAAQQVNTYYIPNPSTVTANSQVTWNNKDIAQHTATATDGSFDTGIINVGSSGSAIVKGQGTVPYHCTIHPWMNGMLKVTT